MEELSGSIRHAKLVARDLRAIIAAFSGLITGQNLTMIVFVVSISTVGCTIGCVIDGNNHERF